MLAGSLNWLSDPIYAILLNTAYYTASPAHSSLADVQAEAFVTSSNVLTGRTADGGVADADNPSFPATSGPIIRALILVRDGGTAIQSKLIAYIDSAQNLPFTPNGNPIILEWDDGPNRIFAL